MGSLIKNNKYKEGFTLIEVMVVIAIIGFMSSILMAGLTATRAKARDTQRIAELKNIEKALNLYSVSNNGMVPVSVYHSWIDTTPTRLLNFTAFTSATLCTAGGGPDNAVQGLFNTLKTAKTLSSIPNRDPMASKGYCYLYITDATGRYAVLATALEGKKNADGYQTLVGVTFGNADQDWLNINMTTGKTDMSRTPLLAP